MKTKLTLIFAMFCLTVFGQKQLQQYLYTIDDESIILKASANSIDNITFTLNNSKGEGFVTDAKSENKSNFEFTVSPMWQSIFFAKIDEQLTKLMEINSEFESKYEPFKKNKEEYLKIFRHFETSANSEFKYDIEPISGTLKYNLNVRIQNESIEDLNKLFKCLAKKDLIEYDKDGKTDYKFKDNECERYGINRKEVIEYLNKSKLKDKGFSKKKSTDANIKILKNIYHEEKVIEFLEDGKFKDYIDNKHKELLEEEKIVKTIKKIEKLKKEKKELHTKQEKLSTLYNSKFEDVEQDFKSEDDLHFQEISDIRNLIDKINIEIEFENNTTKKRELKKTKSRYEDDSLRINSHHERRYKRLNERKKRIAKIWKPRFDSINQIKFKIKSKDSLIKINEKNHKDQLKLKGKLILENKKIVPEIISQGLDFFYWDFKISNINVTIKDGFIDQMLTTGTIDKPYLDFKDIILSLKDFNEEKIEKENEKIKIENKNINERNKEIKKENEKIKLKNNSTKKDNLFYENQVEIINKKLTENIINKKLLKEEIAFALSRIKDLKKNIKDTITPSKLIPLKKEIEPINLSELKAIVKAFYNEPLIKETLNKIVNKELKFTNSFPYGFSSNQDFADLYSYKLVHLEGKNIKYTLPVTEVIKIYNQKLKVDRLDYSPANQDFNLPDADPKKMGYVELKKEKSSKILSGRFYTDFNGFKESNSNGLLQIEIDKKIPLRTKRKVWKNKTSLNYGWFNFVYLNFSFSRIKDKERDLQVSYADEYVNNIYTPKKFVTYMDLVRRENTSIGFDLNIYSMDIPDIKLKFEANLGVHFARVRAIDSLKTSTGEALTNFFNKNVNTLRYYPDFILRVRPEERFGGFVRFRPFRIMTPGENEFFSVSSRKEFIENRCLRDSWLHRYELSLFFKPNPNGDDKFFFRYRNTNVSTWETNGFEEFQLGYLVYLKF